MKTMLLFLLMFFPVILVPAGVVEKTYYFGDLRIDTIGSYQRISFGNTLLSGIPGEPLFPYQEVFLMLPPGDVAVSITISGEDEVSLRGKYLLFPQQYPQPVSKGPSGGFIRNEKVFSADRILPVRPEGKLLTQFLNGYAFAMSTFTPVKYNPAKGNVSYYRKVTVRIRTRPGSKSLAALGNLPASEKTSERIRAFAQNPGMMNLYPEKRSSPTSYQYLIISPSVFKNEFQPLISMYNSKGISSKVITVDSISLNGTGWDLKEKIRNFIINEYQAGGIEYVLLAGNPSLVPCRGFYCYVNSGNGYTDYNIPADLYYSGIDGSYDSNGNHVYGQPDDDPDLLPDISVGRFTVNDTAELHRMIRKTVLYQTNPVLGEMNRPLLAGEYLYNDPLTFGGDYMDLLENDHNDNGYFTHGIPSASNTIDKLYDSLISPPLNVWQWTYTMLLGKINQGKSFIHHLGHSNATYMIRLSMSMITNSNFALVNGITHNYQVLYTQGCYCGAFDADGGCIAAKAVTISNFLVAGIFNSRYGWFNQGTTDGPSQHLEREFVSILYNDTLQEKHLGTAHMISKIKTVPWVTAPGEFEPGAQRWCHYCCNVFGDPAMEIWTEEPNVFTDLLWTGNIDSDWNNPANWSPEAIPTSLHDVTISDCTTKPVITTSNSTFCHDLIIQNGGNITINPGKSIIVRGNVILNP
jgi:hypothetical protein